MQNDRKSKLSTVSGLPMQGGLLSGWIHNVLFFFTSHALTVYSNPQLPNGIKINCQDSTALESYWVGGRGHQSTVPRGQDVNLIFESLQKVQLLKRFFLHIFNQPAQCSLFTEQKIIYLLFSVCNPM